MVNGVDFRMGWFSLQLVAGGQEEEAEVEEEEKGKVTNGLFFGFEVCCTGKARFLITLVLLQTIIQLIL